MIRMAPLAPSIIRVNHSFSLAQPSLFLDRDRSKSLPRLQSKGLKTRKAESY
jgi:hypothetical protein